MSVQWGRGEGPQENKFEQVYSDHHQMSVAWVPPGLVWGQGCTLPCDLTHGAFDVRSIYQPTTKNSPHPQQTQACENSTFNKFRLGVWFKLLSSRTSFQLKELDTADS